MPIFYHYITLFLLSNYFSILLLSMEIKEGEKDMAIMVVMMATKGVLVAAFLSHDPYVSSSTMAQYLSSVNTAWNPSTTAHGHTHILCHHRHGHTDVI